MKNGTKPLKDRYQHYPFPVSYGDEEDPLEKQIIYTGEIADFLHARSCYILARASYERLRAGLVMKLYDRCQPEDGTVAASYIASLDEDGDTLHITVQDSIPSETVVDRRDS